MRAAARAEIARLDRDRAIRAAVADATSQVKVALLVHLTQPRVSQIVAATDEPRPGFSGATPTEIAQRFAAGELDEAQAIDELGRWDYEQPPAVDEYDGLWEPGPGTWLDVEDALSHGLITEEVYAGALELQAAKMKGDG
ncbi:hypothetical protein J7E29_16745 [Streptomyces sp. ISL-90]|nr:hypothetical protein [Streptomyces sp. ISL-90]